MLIKCISVNFLVNLLFSVTNQMAYATCEIIALSDFAQHSEAAYTQVLQKTTRQISNDDLFEILTSDNYVLGIQNSKPRLFLSHLETTHRHRWEPVIIDLEDHDINCDKLTRIRAESSHSRNLTLEIIRRLRQFNPQQSSQNLQNHESLGELLIKTEHQQMENENIESFDLQTALSRYQRILNSTRELKNSHFNNPNRFFAFWKSEVLKMLYHNDQEDIDYCMENVSLGKAMTTNCVNCQGETFLMISLFLDSGFVFPEGWILSIELFRDHIRPILFNADEHLVFDLTYGVFDNPRAAVYSFEYLYLLTLRGFDGTYHSSETRFVNRFDIQTQWKPYLCMKQPKFIRKPIGQLIHPGGFNICRKFSRFEPEEGEHDNSNRTEMTDFNEGEQRPDNTSSGENELNNNDVEAQESFESSDSDSTGGQGGRWGDFSFGSFFKSLGSLFGSERVYEVERMSQAMKDYDRYAERLSPSDLNMLTSVEDIQNPTNQEIINFSNHFEKLSLLRQIGFSEFQSNDIKIILENSVSIPSCRTVTPIAPVSFDEAGLREDTEGVYDFNFYGNDLLLVKNLEDYNILKQLSVKDRYLNLFESLRARIQPNLKLIHDTYSLPINESFEMQIRHSDRIKETINYIQIYTYFMSKLIRVNRCLSQEVFRDMHELLKFTYLGELIDEIQFLRGYVAKIHQKPEDFLAALTTYPDILNHQTKIYPGPHMREDFYSFSEIDGEERLSFKYIFEPFAKWFLLNEQYFFTSPITEVEVLEYYGGVKPYNTIPIRELVLQFGLDVTNHQAPNVNLPKLNQEPCRADEAGYVRRELFFIYCEPGDNGEDEETFGAEADDSNLEENSIPPERESNREIVNSRNDLVPDDVTEILEDGEPDAQEATPDQLALLDPRQQVIIEPEYWYSISKILLKFVDDRNMGLSIHHLQRASNKEHIAQAQIDNKGARFINLATEFFHLDYVHSYDLSQTDWYREILLKKVEKNEVIDNFVDSFIENRDLQRNTNRPAFLSEEPEFLKVAYNHINEHSLKENWSYRHRFNRSIYGNGLWGINGFYDDNDEGSACYIRTYFFICLTNSSVEQVRREVENHFN